MNWISEIETRAEKATPGKWNSFYHNRTETWAVTYEKEGLDPVNYEDNVIALALNGSSRWDNDFDFIAHSRTDIPKLLAALKIATDALKGISHGNIINPHDRAKSALDKINRGEFE